MEQIPAVLNKLDANFSSGRLWFWGSVALNLLLAGGLAVGTLHQGSWSLPTPVSKDASIRPSVDEYFDEIRVLTSILKQTLDTADEQRREIAELRLQLKTTALNHETRAASPSELELSDGKGQK
ncbi:MAG: hypothetical protein IPK68_19490 [Bdellovibrionales bacterium]|nr:hypothetical protein [Bdellovibrionales bacterium]